MVVGLLCSLYCYEVLVWKIVGFSFWLLEDFRIWLEIV